MRQSTLLLACGLASAALVGSANAATFTWTGLGGAGDWDHPDNWVTDSTDLAIPSQGNGRLGTVDEFDEVIFDSQLSVGFVMPSETIQPDTDWFGSGLSDYLQPTLKVLNGTLTYGSGNWWFYGGTSQGLIIGDGNTITAAQVNTAFTNWTRHSDRGGPNKITINADGTMNQTANFTFSSGGSNDTQMTINGGAFISSGSVTNLVTGDPDDFVDFTATGGSFTAPLGSGDFLSLTDVTAAFGTHFLDSTGQGLGATDNGDGTFTVSVIPEPTSLALLGLGGLLIARRRR